MQMEKSDTADNFARKVEKAMADAAGVKTTNFTSHDAFEFAKRHLFERSVRSSGGRGMYRYGIFEPYRIRLVFQLLIPMTIWLRA